MSKAAPASACQVLGACIGQQDAGGVLALLTLVVDPQARRLGLGSALLHAFVEAGHAGAARVEADVATANAPAMRLFSKHGFVAAGLQPGSDAGRGGSTGDRSGNALNGRKRGFGRGGADLLPREGADKARGGRKSAPASIEMVLDLGQPDLSTVAAQHAASPPISSSLDWHGDDRSFQAAHPSVATCFRSLERSQQVSRPPVPRSSVLKCVRSNRTLPSCVRQPPLRCDQLQTCMRLRPL